MNLLRRQPEYPAVADHPLAYQIDLSWGAVHVTEKAVENCRLVPCDDIELSHDVKTFAERIAAKPKRSGKDVRRYDLLVASSDEFDSQDPDDDMDLRWFNRNKAGAQAIIGMAHIDAYDISAAMEIDEAQSEQASAMGFDISFFDGLPDSIVDNKGQEFTRKQVEASVAELLKAKQVGAAVLDMVVRDYPIVQRERYHRELMGKVRMRAAGGAVVAAEALVLDAAITPLGWMDAMAVGIAATATVAGGLMAYKTLSHGLRNIHESEMIWSGDSVQEGTAIAMQAYRSFYRPLPPFEGLVEML